MLALTLREFPHNICAWWQWCRNRSAHGHIHSEVRNKLAPATTEKLVYISSNRKEVAAAACDDMPKTCAWDNE